MEGRLREARTAAGLSQAALAGGEDQECAAAQLDHVRA